MIITYTGTDFISKNKALSEYRAQYEDCDVVFINSAQQSIYFFENELQGVSMFGKVKIIRVNIDELSQEFIHSVIDLIKKGIPPSTHIIFESEKLSASQKKVLEKLGDIKVYEHKKVDNRKQPLSFVISNALLKRDKRNMWIAYRRALEEGEDVYQIHGALMWQLKSIALTYDHSLPDSTLTERVYKSSQFAQKYFSRKQVAEHMVELMDIAHSSKSDSENIEEVLEAWILRL